MTDDSDDQLLSAEELDRAKKYYLDLMAGMFSQAAAFNNVVVAVGYVGAFTLWGYIRPQLDAKASNWIACFLSISMLTFIGWNVFNMLWLVKERLAYGTRMQGVTGDAAIKRWRELSDKTARDTHRLYLRVWFVVIVTTITTAMLAFGILLVNCAVNLFELSI